MAKYGVSLKIDVSKIDKARLFKGQKGTYLDATVFIDTENVSQYGDNGMIAQSVSSEERQQGVKGNILGNCKVFFTEGGQQPQAAPQQYQQAPAPQQAPPPASGGFDDGLEDIPFSNYQLKVIV